jgi:hypothetical protein
MLARRLRRKSQLAEAEKWEHTAEASEFFTVADPDGPGWPDWEEPADPGRPHTVAGGRRLAGKHRSLLPASHPRGSALGSRVRHQAFLSARRTSQSARRAVLSARTAPLSLIRPAGSAVLATRSAVTDHRRAAVLCAVAITIAAAVLSVVLRIGPAHPVTAASGRIPVGAQAVPSQPRPQPTGSHFPLTPGPRTPDNEPASAGPPPQPSPAAVPQAAPAVAAAAVWTRTDGPGCGAMTRTGAWTQLDGSAQAGCGDGFRHNQTGDRSAADWVFTPGTGRHCVFSIYIGNSTSITATNAEYQLFDATVHSRLLSRQELNQAAQRGSTVGLTAPATTTGSYDLQLYDFTGQATAEYAGTVTLTCT